MACDIKPTKSLHAQCRGEFIISHFSQYQIGCVYTRNLREQKCQLLNQRANVSSGLCPSQHISAFVQLGCVTVALSSCCLLYTIMLCTYIHTHPVSTKIPCLFLALLCERQFLLWATRSMLTTVLRHHSAILCIVVIIL